MLLAKTKLNSVKVLISKALINSNSTNDEFASIDNAQKEYDDMNKEIKIPRTP